MRLLDRYLLGQLFGPFVFFLVVFTGVIWLSQSLRVIDTVVQNGQSALVFLEFTALLLPTVMTIVLPVSALAATLYALNRMSGDSEIVVMHGAGMSGLAVLRAVALFSSLVVIALLAITTVAQPMAKRALKDRVSEVRGDMAAAFLREGTFLLPQRGVTIYLREIGRPGELLGVFVHDERDPDQVVTYTAERAVLFQDAEPPVLVMFDGVAQSVGGADGETLSTLRFARFSYDLGQLASESGARLTKPSEMFLPELLTIAEEDTGPWELGEYRAEAHEAISSPFYALVLPLLGAAVVISGGFRRGGVALRIAAAVAAALALRLLGLAANGLTGGTHWLWPLIYAPLLLGLGAAVWLATGIGRGSGSRRAGAGLRGAAAREASP